MNRQPTITRRAFHGAVAAATVGAMLADRKLSGDDRDDAFRLRYLLPSPMYGYAALAEILPEVKKIGADAIDIWPKVHGNQREQLDEMGEGKFAELLAKHQVGLGCITQYKLGPFNLKDEMRLAARFKCPLIVTGAPGGARLSGGELKSAVGAFAERMKPHLEVAEETGVTIAVENHANGLIESPDSMKWLVELRPTKRLAIAFAPYHLPQDEKALAQLIRDLGTGVSMFYAWQHGMGSKKKLPKEQELLQMPGRGTLNFAGLLSALRDVKYDGVTEIFMHPVPRGVAILDSTDAVTKEINRSRDYLTACLEKK